MNRRFLFCFLGLSFLISLPLTGCQKDGFTDEEKAIINKGAPHHKMHILENDNPKENKLLRRIAKRIDPNDPMLPFFIARLRVTLADEGGVGIAAPQVGINKNIIMVKYPYQPKKKVIHSVYLNPKVLKKGKKQVSDWEGCFSVPDGFAKVKRPAWIVIRYDDLKGKTHEKRIPGFEARIILHEMDHLKGILFVDKKEPGKLVPKDQYYKIKAARIAKEKREAQQKAKKKASEKAKKLSPKKGAKK